MQTFLPYEDFYASAGALDKKRCWKQVIEAAQIIATLESTTPIVGSKTIGWRNHPAVKMWQGHGIKPLKYYFNVFLWVCVNKHKINTKYKEYEDINTIADEGGQYIDDWPWWLGNEDFHRAMRARLIEKDKEFYLPKFPEDEGFNNGKYLWPDMQTKTFKII